MEVNIKVLVGHFLLLTWSDWQRAPMHGINSLVGRNVLNCLHYHTNSDNIITLEFQPYDIDRQSVANEDNSIIVTLL